MARTRPYPIRLGDRDRQMLAEIAEQHQRDQPDMIRILIRAEHARIFKPTAAPAAAPSALAPDDDPPFDIVED